MPVREDYLIRMLREMAQVLAGVLRLLGLRQYAEAHAQVQAAARAIGLDLSLLRTLSEESLLALLAGDSVAASERTVAAAEVLRMDGEVYAAEGRAADAERCRVRALRLLLHAWSGGDYPQLSELDERLAELVRKIGVAQLPHDVTWPLLAHLEGRGQYAAAEDLLFAAARRAPDETLPRGREFYARLRARPDAELAAGGLPRAEVEEGALAFAELTSRGAADQS